MSSEQSDKTDRSSSAKCQLVALTMTPIDPPNDNGVTELDFCSFQTSKSDSQRLTDRSFFERNIVRKFVEPSSRVSVESGEGTVVWRGGEEHDTWTCASDTPGSCKLAHTSIVSTGPACVTVRHGAWHTSFDGDSVTDLEVSDVFTHGNNLSG